MKLIKIACALIALSFEVALAQELDLDKIKAEANSGDPIAQFQFGMVYEYGSDQADEATEQQKWYLKIASSSDSEIIQL